MLFVCQQFGTVLYRCLGDWTADVVTAVFFFSNFSEALQEDVRLIQSLFY